MERNMQASISNGTIQNLLAGSLRKITPGKSSSSMDTLCPQGPNFHPTSTAKSTMGTKNQFDPNKETIPNLNLNGIRRVQGIVGSLLYYARAEKNRYSSASDQ